MKIPFPIPEEIKTWKKYQKALSIIERLKQNGFQAFFVGGTVRDMVLKKDINELKDLDIASSAKPEEIGKIFRRCKKVGAKFGVMIVYMGRDFFEVATFRKDEEYDGRRPKRVVYVDAKEDVLRRDFTINGLLLDPFEEVIYDYVNGMKDIENKLVRAIGDPIERFQEDHLRMLRAIRFSCQLNFKIHPNTYSAIIQKAAKILEISKERIKEEFWKIFNSPFPEEGLFHLFQTGLIKYILPEAYSIWAGKEEEFKEFAKSLKNSKEPALFLALLLKDYAWKRTFSLLRERFRVDNETAKKVEEILKLHPQYLQN
ncbi:MAG: CCA tRNA nucleotidyltransferase, partial [Planctomycetota bacterium]